MPHVAQSIALHFRFCLRLVYKPHSVLRALLRTTRMCDHLSGRRVAAPLGAAYPGLTQSPSDRVCMKASRLPPSADDFILAWLCSRRGLPGHLHYCRRRWSLTPPFHSYCPRLCVPLDKRENKGKGATCFCGPFRQVRSSTEASPPRVLSDAVLYGVRTFLDSANTEPRSPNQPEAFV